MSLHLVTGHGGTPHITAADHGSLNACIFGTSDIVMESGENFNASVITNNLIRIYDGELVMQGRHIRLARGTYEDVTIENGTQNMNRNDLIVARYTKNPDSGIEAVSFVVIKGTETTGTAADPEHTTGDILSGDCVLHEMPLYRVPLIGLTVGVLEPMFEITKNVGVIIKTLWENASPESAFAGQVIPLGIANPYDYEYAMAVFSLESSGRKLVSFTKIGFYSEIQHIGNITISTTSTFKSRRWLYGTAGSLTFTDADYKQGLTGTPSIKNEYLIPYAVYGIKGVQ